MIESLQRLATQRFLLLAGLAGEFEMHPTDCIGKRVLARTPHREFIGRLQGVEDWGIAGGGNYLLLVVAQAAGAHGAENAVAVAMRHLEFFEPLE